MPNNSFHNGTSSAFSPTRGQRLRQRRQDLGLSRADLTERIPCRPLAIFNLEHHLVRRPHAATAAGVARELGIEVAEVRSLPARAA